MQNTKENRLIIELHEQWAVKNGYRQKVASCKPQAPSPKPQAPSSKLKNIIESLLDRGPRISDREA